MVLILVIGIIVGTAVCQYFITQLVSELSWHVDQGKGLARLKRKGYQTPLTRILVPIATVLILTLGSWQMAEFYLFNGGYFWLALLSFGLYLFLFIAPWINLILPYKKRFSLSFQILFNESTGTILLWFISLICSSNRLYLDEGGVSSRPANMPLKIITIILLGLYYLSSVGLMALASQSGKRNTDKKSNDDGY